MQGTNAQFSLHSGNHDGSASNIQQLELECVLGLSTPRTGTLSLCSAPDLQHLAAFAAGTCVVLYHTNARRQVGFLRSQTSNRLISAVAFSPDGQHLLAGEAGGGGGNSSAVQVWEVSSGRCIQELRGQHRQGVASLSFSPDGKERGLLYHRLA